MINPWRTSVVVGAAFGLYHLAWASLVAVGLAQSLADFVLAMHFIDVQVHIGAFDLGTATTLVVATTAFGAVLGAAFACLWNWLHEAHESKPQVRSARQTQA